MADAEARRAFDTRLGRARSERMYLTPPIARAAASKCWTLRVESATRTNRVYDLILGQAQMRCSCPDFLKRRRVCKHILFALARVARMQGDVAAIRAFTDTLTPRHIIFGATKVSDAMWATIDKNLMDAMWFHLRGDREEMVAPAPPAAAAAAAAAAATVDAADATGDTAVKPTCCICCEDLADEPSVTCVAASRRCHNSRHWSCAPPCKLVLHRRCAMFWNQRGHSCPQCRHTWRESSQWHIPLPSEAELKAKAKHAADKAMADTFRRFRNTNADIIGVGATRTATGAGDIDGGGGGSSDGDVDTKAKAESPRSPTHVLTLFDTLFERARRGEDVEGVGEDLRHTLQPFRWHQGRHARWIEPSEQLLLFRAARTSGNADLTVEQAIARACGTVSSGAEVDNHAHVRHQVAAHHRGRDTMQLLLDNATLSTTDVPASIRAATEAAAAADAARTEKLRVREVRRKEKEERVEARKRKAASKLPLKAARRKKQANAAQHRIDKGTQEFRNDLLKRKSEQSKAKREHNTSEVLRVLEGATSALMS